MANSHDIANALDAFQNSVGSIRKAYPAGCFGTPDRAMEKYLSFFANARKNSDFGAIRANARNLYNFFEDAIPASATKASCLASLDAALKDILSLLP